MRRYRNRDRPEVEQWDTWNKRRSQLAWRGREKGGNDWALGPPFSKTALLRTLPCHLLSPSSILLSPYSSSHLNLSSFPNTYFPSSPSYYIWTCGLSSYCTPPTPPPPLPILPLFMWTFLLLPFLNFPLHLTMWPDVPPTPSPHLPTKSDHVGLSSYSPSYSISPCELSSYSIWPCGLSSYSSFHLLTLSDHVGLAPNSPFQANSHHPSPRTWPISKIFLNSCRGWSREFLSSYFFL